MRSGARIKAADLLDAVQREGAFVPGGPFAFLAAGISEDAFQRFLHPAGGGAFPNLTEAPATEACAEPVTGERFRVGLAEGAALDRLGRFHRLKGIHAASPRNLSTACGTYSKVVHSAGSVHGSTEETSVLAPDSCGERITPAANQVMACEAPRQQGSSQEFG
jgi:hypothetical protein